MDSHREFAAMNQFFLLIGLLALVVALALTLRENKNPRLRLAFWRDGRPLQEGEAMKVDQPEVFQVQVVDKFGNVVPGATVQNLQVSAGDTTLASITAADPSDPTKVLVTPTGKLGALSLSAKGNVTLADNSVVALTGSDTEALEAGAPAALAFKDIGPFVGTTGASAAAATASP
jgi:hypothetical protein